MSASSFAVGGGRRGRRRGGGVGSRAPLDDAQLQQLEQLHQRGQHAQQQHAQQQQHDGGQQQEEHGHGHGHDDGQQEHEDAQDPLDHQQQAPPLHLEDEHHAAHGRRGHHQQHQHQHQHQHQQHQQQRGVHGDPHDHLVDVGHGHVDALEQHGLSDDGGAQVGHGMQMGAGSQHSAGDLQPMGQLNRHMMMMVDPDEGDMGDGAVPVKSSAASSRRPKSANQVSMLVSHFARNPRPKKAEIKELVGRTGLTYAEIGRWFRNQRTRLAQQELAGGGILGGHSDFRLADDMHKDVKRPLDGSDVGGHFNSVHDHANDHGAGAMSSAGSVHGAAAVAAAAAAAAAVEMAIPMYINPNIGDAYGMRDDDKSGWRSSPQFRRARDTFTSVFTEFPKGSDEREQLLRELVRCLGRSDRESLQAYLRPRGPYRGSADPQLRLITKQERCKEIWAEMERRFGAMQRVEHSSVDMTGEGVGLDPHLLEGLKLLFKPHRDYLLAVARGLEVTEIIKPEVEEQVRQRLQKKQDRRAQSERNRHETMRSPQPLLDPRVGHTSPTASASGVYQPVRGRRGRMEGSPDAGETPAADVDEYYYGAA